MEDPLDLKRQPTNGSWGFAFLALLIGALISVGGFYAERKGLTANFGEAQAIGHITRAYGTVKRGRRSGAARMETGKSLLADLRLGDQVQTGEDSAAEILFFGGAVLQIEEGAVIQFEDTGEDVAIRILMGRAFLELPEAASGGSRFSFRGADGREREVPEGRRLVLTLNAAESLDDAVEVKTVESDAVPDFLQDIEMRYLAHGEEEKSRYPLIVEPIEDHGTDLSELVEALHSKISKPDLRYPGDEALIDVDVEFDKPAFKWGKVTNAKADPIVAYEVEVRPAFGYNVDDTARKRQVFVADEPGKVPIEKVGGAGTFLWTVRAVTASGLRGPASSPHWLEIKFPKLMMAPEVLKPKVE